MEAVTDYWVQLRYRVTYAKVLDSNRKFLEAALRYYELSQVCVCVRVCMCVYMSVSPQQHHRAPPLTYSLSRSLSPQLPPSIPSLPPPNPPNTQAQRREINQDELLQLLAKSVTCAILGKAGPQRSRILGMCVRVCVCVCVGFENNRGASS